MSLDNASIPIGATYAPTGGSATTMKTLETSAGSRKLYLDDGSDMILRKTCLATAKAPVPNSGAPNGYTQSRVTAVFHVPFLLDNGNYTTNSIKIEASFDPELTTAEVEAQLWDLVRHVCVDSDFDDFRAAGSVA